MMKKIKTSILVSCITLIGLFIGTLYHPVRDALAGNAGIILSPNEGTYTAGTDFTVTLTIDGGGEAFNASKATIGVSPNLIIQTLTLGDCGFAFVLTPTTADPSFAGVNLGGSSQKCTLYTMTVRPFTSGIGYISITNPSVKAYNGSLDILSRLQSATYTFAPSAGGTNTVTSPQILIPTQPPLIASSGMKFYNIAFTLTDVTNTPLADTTIVLDPHLPTEKKIPFTQGSVVLSNGLSKVIQFSGIPQGVHTIEVDYKDKKIAESIVNVNGNNRTLVFGMNIQRPNTWLWLVLITIGCILLVSFVYFLYRRYRGNKGIY